MKHTHLLSAGLLMLICGYGYAAGAGGQIDVSLTVLPACEIKVQAGVSQVQCAQSPGMTPKVTETHIEAGAHTRVDDEQRLITVEW